MGRFDCIIKLTLQHLHEVTPRLTPSAMAPHILHGFFSNANFCGLSVKRQIIVGLFKSGWLVYSV